VLFRSQIVAAIKKTIKENSRVNKAGGQAEKIRIKAMWDVGHRIRKICDQLSDHDRKAVMNRFAAEAGRSYGYYCVCAQFTQLFTRELFNKAVANLMTAQAACALIPALRRLEEGDGSREKMIDEVITEKLSADEIRHRYGKRKGAKAAKASKRRIESDQSKEPIQVFLKATDRIRELRDILISTTEAVARLGAIEPGQSRDDAIKQLIDFRELLRGFTGQATMFMTSTKVYETL
jgi:hypothetical protein